MITKTVDKIGNRGLLTSVDINEFTIQLVTHAWGTRGNYFGECYNFFVWINDELCDYSRFLTEEEAQKYFLKKVILLSKKKIPQNDLFLRSFETPGRLRAECLPKSLIKNKNYPFLKRELRDLGIHIEFNPDLCLRAFGTQGRLLEECLPEKLEKKVYAFVKRGLRNFYLL